MATKLYVRTCSECGDVKQVTYKPKEGVKCRTCRKREQASKLFKNRWKGHKEVVYYYFCPTCSSVRVLKAKRSKPYCVTCIKKFRKSWHKLSKYQFNFDTMRVECTYQWTPPPRKKYKYKPKPKPAPKPKPKPALKPKPKKNITYVAPMPEVAPKTPREKEEDMIAEWLKKNKPTVIETKDLAPDYTGCKAGGLYE